MAREHNLSRAKTGTRPQRSKTLLPHESVGLPPALLADTPCVNALDTTMEH
jgi:hypothetical protein